jgi:prevent-host-death family protein
MQFINIRDLSRSPSKYVKLANEKEDVIITKNGHPYAVLTGINGDELEDFILARHFDLEKEFSIAKDEYRSGKTISARELLNEKTK